MQVVIVAGVEEVGGEEAAWLAVDGVAPRLRARPDSAEALLAVLRDAQGEGLAVVPRGAGSKTSLGNLPRRYDLALELGDLRGLLEYRPDDLVAVALAGTPLAELQRQFAAHGQWLALDPPHASAATLGGALAANSSGPHRLRYGTGRDLVLGMCVAYAGGTLARSGARVVKSVAGYDLHKLHVGALGTLGVIVEAGIRLHPLPARRRLVAVLAPEAAALAAVVRDLMRLPLGLGALEALDPGAVRRLNAAAGGGLPGQYVLLALCEGLPEVVARQRTEVARAARDLAMEDLGEDEEASRLMAAVAELPAQRRPEETVLRLGVPPGDTCLVMGEIGAALWDAGVDAALHAHAGSGVLYGALSAEPDGVPAIARDLRQRLGPRRGHLIVEACPVEAKATMDVWGPLPSAGAARLMRELKAAYDPRGILNPGRYVEGL
jgi:glycolate oxidase FAD binding subunit